MSNHTYVSVLIRNYLNNISYVLGHVNTTTNVL